MTVKDLLEVKMDEGCGQGLPVYMPYVTCRSPSFNFFSFSFLFLAFLAHFPVLLVPAPRHHTSPVFYVLSSSAARLA
jgi:hypothetical protein